MRSKNVGKHLLVLFLLAGFVVTSVSASPQKLVIDQPDVEIQAQPTSIVNQEEADPPPVDEHFQLRTSMIQQNSPVGYPELLELIDMNDPSTLMPDPSRQAVFGSGLSQPTQAMINNLPAGMITIDLTYDVVMGWVEPGQLVEVAYDILGYGSAVADGIGFFWTPIWHNTDGHQIGIDCGTSISISVEGSPVASLAPNCFDDTHIVVDENLIRGTLSGAGEGVVVTANLGEFIPYVGSMQPAQGAPTGSGITDWTGLFEIADIGFTLGAESVAALDFEQSGINIRDYVIPQEVFMVHQMNSIQGYTSKGQNVIVTVYVGSGPEVRWTGDTFATWPLGYYSLMTEGMNYGDLVTVELSGGPTLSTTVAPLGNLVFVPEVDVLHGETANGTSIRTVLWQLHGESYNYSQKTSIADSSGFLINFSPEDLKAYDSVLVIATDEAGNQTQILSGAPYIDVLQDPLTNQDCVMGRLDAPYEPIVVSLDKGGDGSIDYVRETGWISNAGNDYDVCFLIRDPNGQWGPINIDPGDIATLSNGSDWSESVDMINFDWDYDTTAETISGQGFPDGEFEVNLIHDFSDQYPLYGIATYNSEIASGEFSASFTNFDVVDGLTIQFTHYNVLGNGNTYYPWGKPALSFFDVVLSSNAVSGWVAIPDDLVTVSLYENESATEPLVITSEDTNGDPYQFWISNFGGYTLEPGMKVAVSSVSGWSGEMIVPVLEITGDYETNEISGVGPQGLLRIDAQRDDQSFGSFIPANNLSTFYLQTDYYGFDLHQGDTLSLIFTASDGNKVHTEVRLGELYKLGHWLNDGRQDWMWGEALPGSNITISIDGSEPIQAYFEDPNCPSCWGIHEAQDINPGSAITVFMDTGYSLTYSVAEPLTSIANSVQDTVSGQIGGRSENWVIIRTWWDGMEYQVNTASDGTFMLQSTPEIPIDVPQAGEGNIYFNDFVDDVLVDMNQHYLTADLLMNVNYDHDWIEGNYPPGYEVDLTVTESDGVTVKATTTLTTFEIPWWGGQTGFSTNVDGVVWDPARPDIQPGDWVFGEVTVDSFTYYSQVKLGTFAGEFRAETNAFTGTLSVPWLDPEVPVIVQCHPWGAPEGTNGRETTVLPDGVSDFTCDWTGEWDVQPDQQIAVTYRDPSGNWVYSVHNAYTDELILRIQYDHNWIEGNYEPDHEIFLQVLDNLGDEKAHITLTSGYIEGWGSTSGFSTNMEGAAWIPYHPDILPGDTILGEVDGGTFTAEVKIGTVTADLDLVGNIVSGTVDAEWLPQGDEVRVSCEIWDWNAPPNKEDWVLPTGSDLYLCDWSGDGYDLNETSNLMVAYYEAAGHKIIGEFRYPAPRLHINKWMEGGEPGEGGNATFNIQYRNEGNASAVNAIITDTLGPGLTYLSDTSGFAKTVDGNEVVWQLGDFAPGDWFNFFVFVHVDGSAGDETFNTVVFSSDSVDGGMEQDRTSTWQGKIIENETHVNVGKGTWTWLPAAGQNYVYNINVCNNGPTGSTELSLIETLPSAVTLVSWWGREAGWSEVSYTSNILTLEYPSIPGWSCREVYIKVNLDPNAQPNDELVNVVDIFAENDDPNEQDNEAWLSHNVGKPFTDLSISLGWHNGILTPGGQYRFGMYFYNDGNLPVEGPLPITLVLPAGVHFGGWSHWDWANLIGEPVVDGNTITWLVDDLDPGYYGTIEVIANIDGGITPGMELTQEVTFVVLPEENYVDNNYSSLSVTVQDHGPNLRINKIGHWSGSSDDGQFAWYRLEVENVGDQVVENIEIRDDFPVEMTLFNSLRVNHGGQWSWDDTHLGEHYFIAYLDRLEPGWRSDVNFDTVVSWEDLPNGATYDNVATIGPSEGDVNPVDNTSNLVLTVGPDLFVQKTLQSGEFLPGKTLSYWLDFGNLMSDRLIGRDTSGNGIITDTLPEGMAYVPGSAYLHLWGQEWMQVDPMVNGQELIWTLGPLVFNQKHELFFDVILADEISQGNPLINTVDITTDNPTTDVDPFMENNTSSYIPDLDLAAPMIISQDNTMFAYGEVGSFTITTLGYPTASIWTDDTLPSWLTLTDQGDGTAILTGTPPAVGGVAEILLKAANGVTPGAEQLFTLTWEGAPVYPLFLPLILR